MSEGFDIAKYNAAIREWGREEKRFLGGSINALGVRSTGALVRQLNVKFGARFGQVNYIGFKFGRYGVWLEKGASRGHGGAKGSQWRTAKGTKRRTSASSLGKQATGARPARPWFNKVMEPGVEKLATLVAEHMADAAINNISLIK